MSGGKGEYVAHNGSGLVNMSHDARYGVFVHLHEAYVDADSQRITLSVDEAKRLRDWLTEVLA